MRDSREKGAGMRDQDPPFHTLWIVIYLVDSIIQRLNNWGSSFTDGDLEDGVFIAMGRRERELESLLSLIKI